MVIQFSDGQPITLTQMLIAKEHRVERQIRAITQYQLPLISLTLVIPGPIKQSSGTDYVFKEAISAIHRYFFRHGIKMIKEELYASITGYEAIIVVDESSIKLKEHCINIEEQSHLGRLWDIDVIDPETKNSLSRTAFSHKPRLCLVCQENAKVCSRSRKHSVTDVIYSIEKLIYLTLP